MMFAEFLIFVFTKERDSDSAARSGVATEPRQLQHQHHSCWTGAAVAPLRGGVRSLESRKRRRDDMADMGRYKRMMEILRNMEVVNGNGSVSQGDM